MDAEQAVVELELDLSRKKKKKVRPDRFANECPVTTEVEVPDDQDYTYAFLLQRAFQHVNKQEATNRKLAIPVPTVSLVGRRSYWHNFQAFCTTCNRPSDHVLEFVQVELCGSCSVSASGALVYKSRVSSGQLQKICRAYLTQFVLCPVCKGTESLLEKDQGSRLTFLSCQTCGSRTSMRPLRRAFVAQLRRQEAEDQ